jgi:FSR family fosmidomycin resistance protein-like MFS transporter
VSTPTATGAGVQRAGAAAGKAVMPVLLAISLVHFLNDIMQAVVPALYPILEETMSLSYAQIGWLSFTFNMTSSVMQPVVGLYADRRPQPYMLPIGMVMSLLGMIGIALAPTYWGVLLAAVFIGLGSAVFHPEGSRVVFFAAGGQRGLAQSVYQVGGNAGGSMAPIMTILIFLPLGQIGALWGTAFAGAAIALLLTVVPWYKARLREYGERIRSGASRKGAKSAALSSELANHPRARLAMGLLVIVIFARSWYHAGIASYYQFYLVEDYGLTKAQAQVPVFLFLAAGVAGTLFGGWLADRIGIKRTIVWSICGSVPFALLLPHLPLFLIYPVALILGFVLLSGFSVSVVYGQIIMPSKVGMVSGLTTGLAFGLGAIGSVAIGNAADVFGLADVMLVAGFLPLLGLISLLLPSDRK